MINFRSSKLKHNIMSVQQQPDGIDCGRFEVIQKGMEKCEKNTGFFEMGFVPIIFESRCRSQEEE